MVLVVSLMLGAGCGDDSPMGPSEPTSDDEPTLAQLLDCEEDDLEYIPFQGPNFDAEGKLQTPLPDHHIVATTAGWAIQDEKLLDEVRAHNMVVMADVFQRDGLLGAGFAWSVKCGVSRSLS